MKRRLIIGTAAAVLAAAAVTAVIAVFIPRTRPDVQTMSVALYPYLPDSDAFEQAVGDCWRTKHPDVGLEFKEWDCYYNEPTEDTDVFVFDALYFAHFVKEGYLLPVPADRISDSDDIIAYAAEGLRSDGTVYAVPQLLCTDLLYTRKEDTELSGVRDIDTLYEKLGDRVKDTERPANAEGLLADLSWEMTKTVMYMDAMCDSSGEYFGCEPVPDLDSISPEALEAVRRIRRMGGATQVNYVSEGGDSFERARWFAQDSGRAYIGFSESMSAMGSAAEDMELRTFSYTKKKNVPLMFCDAAAIRSTIPDEKKELAYDLLDTVTCARTMTAALSGTSEQGVPQYLLPARTSVYDSLAPGYPIYGKLKEIAEFPENKLFQAGADVRGFFTRAEERIPPLVMQDTSPQK